MTPIAAELFNYAPFIRCVTSCEIIIIIIIIIVSTKMTRGSVCTDKGLLNVSTVLIIQYTCTYISSHIYIYISSASSDLHADS